MMVIVVCLLAIGIVVGIVAVLSIWGENSIRPDTSGMKTINHLDREEIQ